MSIATVAHTMLRIHGASVKSPILVLRTKEPNRLDSFFASTVVSKQMIWGRHPDIVGVYHCGMDLLQVKKELKQNITRENDLLGQKVAA